MKARILTLCVAALGLANWAGAADDYPSRPVEYVVASAAGGGTDAIARVVADSLSKKLGQPFMVTNKPGGGCVIGTSYVVKECKADGYTLLADIHSATSMLVAGMVNPPVKLEDRAWIARVAVDPIAFAVKADAPWKDFKEFSDWVKANPEKLTWASVGPAGLSAFGVQDWLAAIGVDGSKTRMVPSKGAADSLPKVAGGHVVLACHTVAECYTLAKAGKVRVLAVSADRRAEALPEVPTAKEQGITGLAVQWWTGVSARAGTPQPILDKLSLTIKGLCQSPEFMARMKAINATVNYLGPKEFAKFVQDEAKTYTALAEKIGIRK